MLTESRYSGSKFSMSDSKIRYGSSQMKTSSRPTNLAQEINQELWDMMRKNTLKRQNPEDAMNKLASKKSCLGKRYQDNLPISIKNFGILIVVLLVTALTLMFNVNIEVEEDIECWNKFKAFNCDILNPQGKECIRLYNCIGKPQYQISMSMIVIGIISLIIGFRFKNHIKEQLISCLKLLDALISNKKTFKQEQ